VQAPTESPGVAPHAVSGADARSTSAPWFWLALGGIVALYLAIALHRVNDVPLVDPDEPRYAAAGRTMLRGGSILVPEFNGQPRINKPPLFYWLVALCDYVSGGASEAASRTPSVVMGLVMIGTTVLLGRHLFGATTGLLAGLMLCTMPLFFVLSRCCITDMTLAGFMAVSLALLMLAFTRTAPPVLATWLAAMALGLAILTKATPAFAIAAVIIMERALSQMSAFKSRALKRAAILLAVAMVCSAISVYFNDLEASASRQQWHTEANPADLAAAESYQILDVVFKSASMLLAAGALCAFVFLAFRSGAGWLSPLPWKMGFAVAVLMGLWWYLALIHYFGWDAFSRLLRYETLGRLSGDMHREPMHYYLTHLFAVTFPWAAGVPAAILLAWPKIEDAPPSPNENADRFLLCWLLGILLFFTIPNAKLATYILAAMPAAALLVTRFVLRAAGDDFSQTRRNATLSLGLIAGIALFAASLALPYYPDLFKQFAALLPVPFALLGGFYGLSVIAGWFLICRRRRVFGVLLLAGTQAIMIFVTAPAGIPTFLENRSERKLALETKDKIADCTRVASVGAELESLCYYLDRNIAESRRRRLVNRRPGTHDAINPNDPPVTEDEPFDSVVKEELARPEKVALYIQRRYYARMLGIKGRDFEAMTTEQVKASVPPYALFVATDKDLVVIRNRH